MRIKNRSPFKLRARAGTYKIENKASEATVYIYDEIGWFGISAEDFIKDFNAIDAKTINIRLNTPGGSVFDGTAIFNAIRQHKSKTITHIDGLAASIGSIIALASDEVRMAENAFFMLHEAWSIVIGNADIMREEAELLDKVDGVIAKTYMDKTGKDKKEIKKLMKKETWMTADEAKEMGFIDVIDGEKEDEKAKATLFDLSVFANVPDELKEGKKMPTARDMEKALRDVGLSQKQAKSILSNGLEDYQRDVDEPEPEMELKEVERDVELADQREVDEPKPKKDRTDELLRKAKLIQI